METRDVLALEERNSEARKDRTVGRPLWEMPLGMTDITGSVL